MFQKSIQSWIAQVVKHNGKANNNIYETNAYLQYLDANKLYRRAVI